MGYFHNVWLLRDNKWSAYLHYICNYSSDNHTLRIWQNPLLAYVLSKKKQQKEQDIESQSKAEDEEEARLEAEAKAKADAEEKLRLDFKQTIFIWQ